jgi:hypothetical protein
MAPTPLQVQEPAEWGPTLWSYLHALAERLGSSGSPLVDTDQAIYLTTLLQNLPRILPCPECQAHATQYLADHPLPTFKDLHGPALRLAARDWLFAFHQAVRLRKEQPLLFTDPADCVVYQDRTIPKADYQRVVQTVTAAIRQGWVRMDEWRKWFAASEKLRLLCGSLVR